MRPWGALGSLIVCLGLGGLLIQGNGGSLSRRGEIRLGSLCDWHGGIQYQDGQSLEFRARVDEWGIGRARLGNETCSVDVGVDGGVILEEGKTYDFQGISSGGFLGIVGANPIAGQVIKACVIFRGGRGIAFWDGKNLGGLEIGDYPVEESKYYLGEVDMDLMKVRSIQTYPYENCGRFDSGWL